MLDAIISLAVRTYLPVVARRKFQEEECDVEEQGDRKGSWLRRHDRQCMNEMRIWWHVGEDDIGPWRGSKGRKGDKHIEIIFYCVCLFPM